MDVGQLKALAEKFRAVNHSHEAVKKLADETIKANPNDTEALELCNRFRATADPKDVLAIADEVKGR